MKKLLTSGVVSAFLIAGLALTGGVVQAQEDDIDSSTSVIEALREQIEELQEQVADLQARLSDQADDDSDVSERMRVRIEERLEQGSQGVNVRRLQQMLATDGDIYPEGLVTGFYGPLTTSAVARLQGRMGLQADGEVGSTTLSRINQLLEEGAGNSGVIPPGLLRAPGIQRMMNMADTSTSTDDDDSSDDDDRIGPDFENLPISETLRERLRALFENKDGEPRFRFRSRTDDGDDREELEIEVEIEDDRARIEIEHRDGTETRYRFEFTDQDKIIEEIESRTGLTEEEIRSVIEFESEDEDDDDDDNEDDDEDDDDSEEDDEDSDDETDDEE